MFYGIYKNARNAAWRCLIDFKIAELPVKVTEIAKNMGVTVLKDSNAQELNGKESGKTVLQNNKFYVIYKDTEPSSRCRFTIAHELGHIFLGHLLINAPQYRTFAVKNDTESAANIFARDLLAPACVLHELQVLTPDNIAKLCNISLEAATYRADRMQELEKRNAWYLHPLEKRVYEQFENFIKRKKSGIKSAYIKIPSYAGT